MRNRAMYYSPQKESSNQGGDIAAIPANQPYGVAYDLGNNESAGTSVRNSILLTRITLCVHDPTFHERFFREFQYNNVRKIGVSIPKCSVGLGHMRSLPLSIPFFAAVLYEGESHAN